ncbi:ABC1-domain-containing protein [Neoconidiobolus thromboides FSU 785]|nr:ABC1-domain-containing protein [Neoconidiobolus thromboides FSU 785]
MAVGTGLEVIIDYRLNWPFESDNNSNSKYIEQQKKEIHQRNANRVLKAMLYNGGFYIKLGQHLTALNYFLPMEWCVTFRPLHDACPATKLEVLDKMVLLDTGKSLNEIFEFIEPEPIGVASIAQVHKGIYQGKEIAVKLQHPKVGLFSKLDLLILDKMVNLAQFVLPQFQFSWLINEIKRNLPKELDFEIEGENGIRAKQNFDLLNYKLLIPKVYWATKRILCMEFIDGKKLNDVEYFKENQINPRKVSIEINQIFSEMLYRHRFIHCDAHPGNLMIIKDEKDSKKNFKIVLLDHGLYHELNSNFINLYAHLWINILQQNEDQIKEYSIKLGGNSTTYRLIKAILTARQGNSKDFNFEQKVIQHLPNIAKLLADIPNDLVYLFKIQDLLKLISMELKQDPYLQFKILGDFSHLYLMKEFNWKVDNLFNITPKYFNLLYSYYLLRLKFLLLNWFYKLSILISPLNNNKKVE